MPAVDEAGTGGARRGRHLARVVGVQRHEHRLFLRAQAGGKLGRDALGRNGRNARVPAQDLDVGDGAEGGGHLCNPARRQDERVAAGQDHLPNLGMTADVVQRSAELFVR